MQRFNTLSARHTLFYALIGIHYNYPYGKTWCLEEKCSNACGNAAHCILTLNSWRHFSCYKGPKTITHKTINLSQLQQQFTMSYLGLCLVEGKQNRLHHHCIIAKSPRAQHVDVQVFSRHRATQRDSRNKKRARAPVVFLRESTGL
jgi:hypothetical protein